MSVQGRTSTFHKLLDEVVAFKAKLEEWERRVKIDVFDKFQTLAGIWGEIELLHNLLVSVLKRVWSIISQPKKEKKKNVN